MIVLIHFNVKTFTPLIKFHSMLEVSMKTNTTEFSAFFLQSCHLCLTLTLCCLFQCLVLSLFHVSVRRPVAKMILVTFFSHTAATAFVNPAECVFSFFLTSSN